jgi:hypothetical protein
MPAQRAGLLAVLMLLSSAGCDGRKIYPVRGRVVFADGSVMAGGWVTFEPLDSAVKASASGDIQPDGTFILTTERKGDGAIVGRYRVLVSPPRSSSLDETAVEPRMIHSKYRSFDTSPLEVEVKPDKNANQFTLTVER